MKQVLEHGQTEHIHVYLYIGVPGSFFKHKKRAGKQLTLDGSCAYVARNFVIFKFSPKTGLILFESCTRNRRSKFTVIYLDIILP